MRMERARRILEEGFEGGRIKLQVALVIVIAYFIENSIESTIGPGAGFFKSLAPIIKVLNVLLSFASGMLSPLCAITGIAFFTLGVAPIAYFIESLRFVLIKSLLTTVAGTSIGIIVHHVIKARARKRKTRA